MFMCHATGQQKEKKIGNVAKLFHPVFDRCTDETSLGKHTARREATQDRNLEVALACGAKRSTHTCSKRCNRRCCNARRPPLVRLQTVSK